MDSYDNIQGMTPSASANVDDAVKLLSQSTNTDRDADQEMSQSVNEAIIEESEEL